MHIPLHSFETLDWLTIPKEEHPGITGTAYWQTVMVGDIRIRMVEYAAGYAADHWCSKGHIIFCIDGEMETELKDGRKFILKKGMTYHVGDNSDDHRTSSVTGCRLFIVD
jgi:quercetin dioxygenase-like cupin family protein